MQEKLISIVIPVFNREKYIDECIKSALNQSYNNYEIIIIDNKSTDFTWRKIEKFNDRSDKIKIFQNKENIGPVQNWKKAISLASGEYIKILFSDDLIEKECLVEMINVFSEEDAFVVSSVRVGLNQKESKTKYNYSTKKRNMSMSGIEYIMYNLSNFGTLVSPGAALFRKKDLINNFKDNLPLYDDQAFSYFGAGPDLLLFLLTAIDYKSVKIINYPLAFFRDHNESATISALTQKSFDISRSYNETKLWFANNYLSKENKNLVSTKIYFSDLIKNIFIFRFKEIFFSNSSYSNHLSFSFSMKNCFIIVINLFKNLFKRIFQ